MKKQLIATIAAASVLASALAAAPLSVSAAGTNYSTSLTDASINTTSFTKYLVMESDANVPNTTFSFTVAPGSPVAASATDGTLAVLAGIGNPVIGSAAFTAEDTTTLEAGANEAVVFKTEATTDEKYAEKTVSIDFSAVPFVEPGVYRYIITENVNTSAGITNDAVTTRTLDVYVEDASDDSGKALKITGYRMYSGTITTAPKADGTQSAVTKSDSFTNSYETHNLTFGKEVTGNQGSKDKYFCFTLSISNATPGTVYTVDLSRADGTSGTNDATIEANQGQTNAPSLTVHDNGSVTKTYYLQDGQYITIQGLAPGTQYTLGENSEDYTSTTRISASVSSLDWDASVEGNDALSDPANGAIESADIHTGFTNDRSGTIPTGILMSIAKPAILGIVILACIAFLIIRSRKHAAEDEA